MPATPSPRTHYPGNYHLADRCSAPDRKAEIEIDRNKDSAETVLLGFHSHDLLLSVIDLSVFLKAMAAWACVVMHTQENGTKKKKKKEKKKKYTILGESPSSSGNTSNSNDIIENGICLLTDVFNHLGEAWLSNMINTNLCCYS